MNLPEIELPSTKETLGLSEVTCEAEVDEKMPHDNLIPMLHQSSLLKVTHLTLTLHNNVPHKVLLYCSRLIDLALGYV